MPEAADQPLVDLHTHVLPGLDDGARDIDEALAMLRAAEADGIAVVAATPHAHHVAAARVLSGVESLRRRACEAGIGVRIIAGQEARVASDLAVRVRDGRLLTFDGSDWLLVECYLSDDWPLDLILRSFERVIAAGLRPILAHAERYGFVQRDKRSLLPFIERGIPVQLNAGSLFLPEHAADRICAERLLRSNLVHLVASDAHSARYRSPALRPALARAAELTGDGYAAWLASVPARILSGQAVDLPDPVIGP